ncbi:MAG: lipopolysaccharide assembly protein A [Thiomicrorhabdus sp.]|nr:MAG: lipopolysaccharide assembly protein A [Thiomicrorhabdus sp.]
MFKLISLVITLLFLALGVVLGVLNPGTIELNLFLFNMVLPLSLVLAIVFVIGALLGASVLLVEITKLKWQFSKQKRINEKQLDQIIQLKRSNAEVHKQGGKPSSTLLKIEK